MENAMKNEIIDKLRDGLGSKINIDHIGGYEGVYIVECSIVDCCDNAYRLMFDAVELLRPLTLDGRLTYNTEKNNRAFYVVFKGKDIVS